jgi:hypothetical protein
MQKRGRSSYRFSAVLYVAIVVFIAALVLPPSSKTSDTHPGTVRPGTDKKAADSARINQAYGKLPLSFEENHGQAPPNVKFISGGAGHSLFLTSNEAVMVMADHRSQEQSPTPAFQGPLARSKKLRTVAVRMRLKGANAKPEILGENPLGGTSNYFIGKQSVKLARRHPNL